MGPTDERRRRLEAHWRSVLQGAQQRYYEATTKYRETVEERVQILAPTPDGAFAVRQAAIAEVAARREYARVLHIFTDLVVSGKEPKEETARRSKLTGPNTGGIPAQRFT